MNWKPEGWNESRDVMAKECAEDEFFKNSDLETLIKAMFDNGAEAILLKVCSEIEKVKNPYSKYAGGDAHETGFEACRQKILTLLKE